MFLFCCLFFSQFDITWHNRSKCEKSSRDTFPGLEFPPGFTYAGNYVVEGITYYKWEKTSSEGSYSEKETFVTKKTAKNHDAPVRYELASADDKEKTNRTDSLVFPFFDEEVDEGRFALPKLCGA